MPLTWTVVPDMMNSVDRVMVGVDDGVVGSGGCGEGVCFWESVKGGRKLEAFKEQEIAVIVPAFQGLRIHLPNAQVARFIDPCDVMHAGRKACVPGGWTAPQLKLWTFVCASNDRDNDTTQLIHMLIRRKQQFQYMAYTSSM